MNLREHVSFSEIKNWKECPWRHKLMYLEGIKTYENNPYAEFGTVVHSALESFLKTRAIDLDTARNELHTAWEKYGFDTDIFIDKMRASRSQHGMMYRHEALPAWEKSLETILTSVPDFLTEEFGDWKLVSAEDQIYEHVSDLKINFKGYIDAIIETEKKGKKIYWVLDWKTSGPRGWDSRKRRDFLAQVQIGFYKQFWSSREGIPIKDVRCAYVILKRNTKPEKCINFIPISVGPKFIERSDKLMLSMVKGVRNKLFLKNRNSCRFCSFYNTEHCT